MGEQLSAAENDIPLFGDPRSALVERGPDRRQPDDPATDLDAPPPPGLRRIQRLEASSAIRLGRGDFVATALGGLGVLSFIATLVASSLILYNAKRVGAFENPWDSTRVAVGLAVMAVGTILSALLIGVSRAISYLLADLRLRAHDLEQRVDR